MTKKLILVISYCLPLSLLAQNEVKKDTITIDDEKDTYRAANTLSKDSRFCDGIVQSFDARTAELKGFEA